MEKDSKHTLTELAVDGGMSNSDLCMQVCISLLSLSFPRHPRLLPSPSPLIHKFDSLQTQSNIIGIPVERPAMRETTALGAAIAAGFAVGVWETYDELKNINRAGRTVFTPKIGKEEREKMFGRWTKAVEMCRGWAE